MCEKIRQLCYKADIITPNVAELAFIADEEYKEDYDSIVSYGQKLVDSGVNKIVVTGYKEGDSISNIVFDNGEVKKATAKLIGGYYSGTGDVTSSIIIGGVLKGMTLYQATKLATDFISKVIENTNCINHNDGIDFERFLGDLV
jgi:pyridoxine kinase